MNPRAAARYLGIYDNQLWYHVGKGNLDARTTEFGKMFDRAELDRFARRFLRRRPTRRRKATAR